MPNVLLIEDSTDCQTLVSRALQGSVELKIASAVADAKKLLAENSFDLLLLDVELPDGNGFGFCSTLLTEMSPTERRPRIIFLTGEKNITEKLTGFSVGGIDYITKPFDPLELKARVLAQLNAQAESLKATELLQSGSLSLDLASHTAEIRGLSGNSRIDLTPTEFRLLTALIKNKGRVLTREQLLNVARDHGEEIMDRTIDAHLCKLRKKLGPHTRSIEAVYGIGYRWVAA